MIWWYSFRKVPVYNEDIIQLNDVVISPGDTVADLVSAGLEVTAKSGLDVVLPGENASCSVKRGFLEFTVEAENSTDDTLALNKCEITGVRVWHNGYYDNSNYMLWGVCPTMNYNDIVERFGEPTKVLCREYQWDLEGGRKLQVEFYDSKIYKIRVNVV